MTFYVTRPHPRKKGFLTGEWLSGHVEKADAESEALALLRDPRDTICGVYLWNDRFGQFDGKWHINDRKVKAALEAATV